MEKLLLPAIHLFGLLAFIIYKTKDSFVKFMKTRFEEVSEGLNKAKVQTATANSKKQEIEARFANLQKEKEIVFSDWKEREASQLKEIKDSSVKIIAQMNTEAELNRKSLEVQIREQVTKSIAGQIIGLVEEKVKAGLNEQTHKGINEQFVKEVSA